MLENVVPGTDFQRVEHQSQAMLQRDVCVTSAREGSKRAKISEVLGVPQLPAEV